uniref:SMAP domain-containing protein n=1 Tax=Anopheles christyi TaxID=43041 RepID=A0A182JXC8_9DIPT
MDFLRNYEADQDESEDMDSNRERTASPTDSSSSAASAGSRKRRTTGKPSGRPKEKKHEEKEDKTHHNPRKDLNENSSSSSSRTSSRSNSTDDSRSKSPSRSPSPASRTKRSRNGAHELKSSLKTPPGNKNSKVRQSKSPSGEQLRAASGSNSKNKSPMKADRQDRKKSSPQKQDASKRDRRQSHERDRKNREKDRERERDRTRDRERNRDRDHERERQKDRQKDRNRDRERDRERERDRHREQRTRYDRDRGSARDVRGDHHRDQRRGGNWSKSNERDNNRRDTRGYDRNDDRKERRSGRDYDKDHRRSRRSGSRESRNRRRQSPNERIPSSRTRDSRSRSRSRSRSCGRSSPPRASVQQTPTANASHAGGGLLPTPSRFTQSPTTKPTSLLPTPPASQSLLGAAPSLPSTAGIPSLMSIPTKPPIGSLIPPAVAAKLNLSTESKLGQLGLPLTTPPAQQDPAVASMLLSRSALLRNNAKAAQLEKMGIDVLQQNQKAVDSVPLPSYYNPGVVNPVRYADQVQKRKLLWSHKTTESKEVSSNISKWEQAKFSQDTDGRVASKFLRLMGVKDAVPKAGEEGESPVETGAPSKALSAKVGATSSAATVGSGASNGGKSTGDSIKKQEELFSTMEQQYEVARQVTHTMRGVGLGFGSQARQF